jgi:polyisoprenyl-teichoic acid--peptidoglycan teichoic acid transferase
MVCISKFTKEKYRIFIERRHLMSNMESRKTNRKRLKVILLSLVVVLLCGLGGGALYVSKLFKQVNTEVISQEPKDIGIAPELEEKLEETGKAKEIINIALFGLDQRSVKERGRSDSIMILTIDEQHKKIKLSSIMRDSYVDINGRGKDKINHAYAFGGPQLAVRTLNENYNLNIKDYVTVNFFGLAKIIDALGGVTIDVKESEVAVINANAAGTASLSNETAPSIKGPGKQVLNGVQAVGYSRERHTGNGDYERTDRQRRVLSALMEKVQTLGPGKYNTVVSKLLPHVLTNMNSLDIMKLGTNVFTSGTTKIEQVRFPLDGYCKGKRINGIYYLTFDEKATKEQMYKYIFEDIKPTAKK